MSGDSQEKSLQPSQRKLRKAREKGQVASSADFVKAVSLAAGSLVVLVSWPGYTELFTGSFRLVLDAALRPASGGTLKSLMSILGLVGQALMPLLVIVVCVGFVAHIVHKRGLVFSIHPILPDFSRINPGEGFKTIFSIKNSAEFGIALLRCLAWFAVAGLITWYAAPQLVVASICELPCVSATAIGLIQKLVIVALLFLIVSGLLDLPFQSFMFLQQQKMSRTEMKHERKESEGSPEFSGHRRDLHRQMAAGGGAVGMKAASIVIVSSGEAVAIRYDAQAQPVPIVVAKGKGIHADALIAVAEKAGTPVETDPRLAIVLSRIAIGANVPESEFNALALALFRHRLT